MKNLIPERKIMSMVKETCIYHAITPLCMAIYQQLFCAIWYYSHNHCHSEWIHKTHQLIKPHSEWKRYFPIAYTPAHKPLLAARSGFFVVWLLRKQQQRELALRDERWKMEVWFKLRAGHLALSMHVFIFFHLPFAALGCCVVASVVASDTQLRTKHFTVITTKRRSDMRIRSTSNTSYFE